MDGAIGKISFFEHAINSYDVFEFDIGNSSECVTTVRGEQLW